MNPVNEAYGPVFARILEPLIRDGYLAIVYGGADVGEHLTGSDLVDTVHITGSERTHDIIVFGPGAAGQEAKAAARPRTTKPIRSELGGASPTIVVPGPWSTADIAYQAQHLATQKLFSAGHTCVASQVLILPKVGPQGELLDALRSALAAAPDRAPFYPAPRSARTPSGRPTPRQRRSPARRTAPCSSAWTPTATTRASTTRCSSGLPHHRDRRCRRRGLPDKGGRVRQRAPARQPRGEHPDPPADGQGARPEARGGHRRPPVRLHRGQRVVGIRVPVPPGCLGRLSREHRHDIQSGVGVVHNALLFDSSQKTVARAPFRPFQRSLRHPREGLGGEAAVVPEQQHRTRDRARIHPVRRRPQAPTPPQHRRPAVRG